MKSFAVAAAHVCALFVIIATASTSPAAILTFDDLPATGSSPPNGYGGVKWPQAWGIMDAVSYGAGNGPNGYTAGMVSANNVNYVGEGATALITSIAGGSKFDFYSAYLTAAWNDGLSVRAIGSFGGSTLYDNTYILSASTPTFINFGYTGVDSVQMFMTAAGTHHAGYANFGTQWLMDDASIVPEPGPVLLLGLGASLLMFLRRRPPLVNV